MRLSLFWRIGLTYLLLLFLVLLGVDIYTVRTLRRDYVRASYERLKSLSQMVHGRVPDVNDAAALGEWARWVARSGARTTVVAVDGRVLADSHENPGQMENHAGRPEIAEALQRGEGRAQRHSSTLNRDLLYLAVREPRDRTGVVVRFALPLEEIGAPLESIRRRLWGMSAVILLLAGGASLLFSRRFSRRVDRLIRFSRRVAQGDFRSLPPEDAGDELAELATTLNETATRLASSIGALTDERNRSAAILRSMTEAVAVVSADGSVVFCNDVLRQAFGLAAEAAEGRHFTDVLSHTELVNAVRRALAGAEETRAEVTLGGARARTFAVAATPVRHGGATGALLVLHDITELRRLERARRDFVANVSHEIRTPLTAIQGFAETLLGGALEDSQNSRRFVQIIRDHAERMARLTEDLLRLSTIESGRLELEMQPVALPDVVEPCVETARLRLEQSGLSLTVDVPESLPPVLGDPRRLRDVLQNLLDNAIQYTEAGGSIRVHASAADGNFVRISVSDTGIGIPEADQQRIFERFYRVDAARSRAAGGTGLGLAIARHLVEAHRGRIEVESAVRRGSTFSVYLPAA